MIKCKCKKCNKEIEKTNSDYEKATNHFCSSSCAAKFNNSLRRKKSYCKECNKLLPKKTQKFCSHTCQQDYTRSKKIEEGTAGTRALKTYLERKENKCSICKLENNWNHKKLVLIMDHIDGNSENNDLSNLRLVCPNCDSQLPTFKSKNKGMGRHKRRQRYKEGKSY